MYSSNTLFALRVVLGLLGVFAAFFAPPYVPLIIMGILALVYAAWEALLLGLLVDLLWLPSGSLFDPLPVFTFAALILVWGLEPLRSEYLIERA